MSDQFPCISCGWCCQRTPCPLAIYHGEKSIGRCSFLVACNNNTFRCGLIINEVDPLKKEAAKILIHSGEGCSHIYGPHPKALVKLLIQNNILPHSDQWKIMKQNTISEFQQFIEESSDPISLSTALDEFLVECDALEKDYN